MDFFGSEQVILLPFPFYSKLLYILNYAIQTQSLAFVLENRYTSMGFWHKRGREVFYMPSYFCSRCHDLITLDEATDPNTVVCEKCNLMFAPAIGEDIKKDRNGQKDKANIKICPVADWK